MAVTTATVAAAAEPLSVWPVAQRLARVQRRGRYLPASNAHPGKMLPALAAEAIRRYSQPGELVLDPLCGIGTTLVEAIHQGREAVGVELEPRWAALAAANIHHAREQGASGNAVAVRGDARRLGRGLLDQYAGACALILSSPPYGNSTHGHVRKHADRVEKRNTRYSRNPDNLAHLPQRPSRSLRQDFASALAEILAGCHRMLSPGGRLVLTARPYRQHGALVDLPGQLIGLAGQAGLELVSRQVALLCGLRGDQLVPRASFFQIQHQRNGAIPRMLIIAHEDVLVFQPSRTTARS
ncbi:MAG: site-specific DNA-methyltransferase [Acidobacteriota bacterium]|nr:site-specific DNA-methyltransferase [Acidobacteriota bacterium]